MRDKEQAIGLIAKLHEITVENGATPAEAERAAGHAARLLAEHNLSLFDVSAQTFDDVVTEESRTVDSSITHPWIVDLAASLGRPLECNAYFGKTFDSAAGKLKVKITFIGHKADAAVASYLWDTLSPVLYDMATVSGRAHGRTSASLVAYRNQFIRHAAYAISRRLYEEKERAETLHEAEAGQSTTAMVHVKSTAVAEYIEQKPLYAKASNIHSKASEHDVTAQMNGHRAGKTVPIRKGIESPAAVPGDRQLGG